MKAKQAEEVRVFPWAKVARAGAAILANLFASGLCVGAESTAPRLAGLIDLPGNKCAVVEVSAPPMVKQSLILHEGERNGDFEMLQINAESGSVRLAIGPNRDPVELHLKRRISGSGLVFVEAELDDILKMYAEFSGRNLLRWPQLPTARLNVQTVASSSAEAATALQSALGWDGIAVVPDGDKFLMVVPKDKVGVVKPHSSELKSGRGAKEELIPQGVISFKRVDVHEIAKIYAELLGRKLERTEFAFPMPVASFENQTPLIKNELVYALETLFAWNGAKLALVGDDKARLEFLRDSVPAK